MPASPHTESDQDAPIHGSNAPFWPIPLGATLVAIPFLALYGIIGKHVAHDMENFVVVAGLLIACLLPVTAFGTLAYLLYFLGYHALRLFRATRGND